MNSAKPPLELCYIDRPEEWGGYESFAKGLVERGSIEFGLTQEQENVPTPKRSLELSFIDCLEVARMSR